MDMNQAEPNIAGIKFVKRLGLVGRQDQYRP
jgi:hypothetical protein